MRASTLSTIFLLLSSFLRTDLAAQEGDGLRVYISADMEGVVGVVTGDALGPGGFEYEQARRYLTEEVNAAIRAAREAGATHIVGSDSHGNGENLRMYRFPDDIFADLMGRVEELEREK